MNKRDLIKALFKDPTIKALYESGHFNPTDINRAILTEAAEQEGEPVPVVATPVSKISEIISEIVSYFQNNEYSLSEGDNEQKDILRSYDGNDPIPFLKSVSPKPVSIALDGPLREEILAQLEPEITSLNQTLEKVKQKLRETSSTNPNDEKAIEKSINSILKHLLGDPKKGTLLNDNQKELLKPWFKSKFNMAKFKFGDFLDSYLPEDSLGARKSLGEWDEIFVKFPSIAGVQPHIIKALKALAEFYFDESGSTSTESETDDSTPKEYNEDQKKEYMSLAKIVLQANALINNSEFVKRETDFLKSLDDTNFLEELVLTYLATAKRTEETSTTLALIKKYAGDENIKALQQQIAKLKASLDKIQGKSTTSSGEADSTPVNEYIDGLVKAFDEKVTKSALQKLTQWSYKSGNYDAKNISILKAFIAHAAQDKKPVNESEQVAQSNLFLDASVKSFIEALNQNAADDEDLINLATSILEKAAENEGFQEIFEDLRDNMNLPASSSEEESMQKKRQQLLQRASSALAILNVKDNELLKNDVFMIFMGSVLEKEEVIREVEEQLESYVDKYLPQLQNEETRKEFYITADEVGELKTFLEANKSEVDKIITAAIKSTKDNKDPSMDDESPPDLAEFQEKWTEELQTFFGKNPERSSFMRRLLLSSQAEMLYNILATLEEIADPAQMAALTDMNQDDEKENQAEEEVEPQLQENRGVLQISDKPKDRSEVVPDTTDEEREQQLKTAQGTSMDVAAQDFVPDEQPQPDKVELPAENKRIIKQDLQSMVDLLRQLKKAISSYSTYSTQKSVDPRFDGSKLKSNMDGLLTQVQDDIYDLHSNLKPPAPKATPEPQDKEGNLEEALNGIMLEEADPERQEQIKFVREVYDNAKQEYIYSLATSMEGGKWSKSQQSANDILKILKDDKFISMFPTGMKTSSGRVMTVGKAYESMKEVIQDFIETVRDIVLISKTRYVSPPSLTQARNNLLQISIRIADLFRVASKLPPEEIKKAKEAEAADPKKKALTPVDPDKLEVAPGDHGVGNSGENGSSEEEPQVDDWTDMIQNYYEIIASDNVRVEPNKTILDAIDAPSRNLEESTQLAIKQLLCYFILYSLPAGVDETSTAANDRKAVGSFLKKAKANPKLKVKLDEIEEKVGLHQFPTKILSMSEVKEIYEEQTPQRTALIRTLESDAPMQKLIASLKGESSEGATDSMVTDPNDEFDTIDQPEIEVKTPPTDLEESLRPIIEKMLNEQYNH